MMAGQKGMAMTKEQKLEWLGNASPEDLLKQYRSMIGRAEKMEFGKEWFALTDDIELTEKEILKRMQ